MNQPFYFIKMRIGDNKSFIIIVYSDYADQAENAIDQFKKLYNSPDYYGSPMEDLENILKELPYNIIVVDNEIIL